MLHPSGIPTWCRAFTSAGTGSGSSLRISVMNPVRVAQYLRDRGASGASAGELETNRGDATGTVLDQLLDRLPGDPQLGRQL